MNIDPKDSMRLLRENWRDPTMLAQELVAMFRQAAERPRVVDGPLTIHVPEGQEPIVVVREKRDRREDSAAPTAVSSRRPSPAASDGSPPPPQQSRAAGVSVDDLNRRLRQLPAPRPAPPPPPAESPAFIPAPLPVVNVGEAETVNEPEIRRGIEVEAPIVDIFDPPPYGPIGSGLQVYAGTVIEGVGDTWTVKLYGKKKRTNVDVTIPFIADDEEAPVGLDILPIVRFGNSYFYQPPVWMD